MYLRTVAEICSVLLLGRQKEQWISVPRVIWDRECHQGYVQSLWRVLHVLWSSIPLVLTFSKSGSAGLYLPSYFSEPAKRSWWQGQSTGPQKAKMQPRRNCSVRAAQRVMFCWSCCGALQGKSPFPGAFISSLWNCTLKAISPEGEENHNNGNDKKDQDL